LKVRTSRVGPAEVRAGEVSAGDDGLTEVVTIFIVIRKRKTRELRIREVGLAEVCAGQVGANATLVVGIAIGGEVRIRRVGLAEIGIDQRGLSEKGRRGATPSLVTAR
jgi:hypothetical protein